MKVIKIIIIVLAFISLLIALIGCIGARAESAEDFKLIPVVPEDTMASVRTSGIFVGERVSGSNHYSTWIGMPTAANVPCYCANVNGTLYCYSTVAQSIYRSEPTTTTISYVTGTWNTETTYDNDYSYIEFSMYGFVPDSTLPYYSTITEAKQAFSDFLSNPTYNTAQITFNLPSGNVAFIKFEPRDSAGAYEVRLQEDMPMLSSLYASQGENAWPLINQYIGHDNSLPTYNTDLDTSGLTLIPWAKRSTTNALGQSQTGVYAYDYNGSDYIVIFNPAYYEGNKVNLLNHDIEITVYRAIEITVYETQDTLVSGIYSTLLGNMSWEMTSDNPDVWVDSEGNNTSPSVGGDNLIPEDATVTSLLSNLVEEVRSIFQITWRPINGLITQVTNYFSLLRNLWGWLPDEIVAIFAGGVGVVVAIGIFKSFL